MKLNNCFSSQIHWKLWDEPDYKSLAKSVSWTSHFPHQDYQLQSIKKKLIKNISNATIITPYPPKDARHKTLRMFEKLRWAELSLVLDTTYIRIISYYT